MADVLFLRHGETDWNEEDRLRGWSPIPLNKEGREEAQQSAQFLSQFKLNHITSADLPRVIQTAYPIAKLSGAPLTLDSRYRDMDYGDWTGVPVQQILPQLLQIFKTGGTAPGASESYEQMRTRVLQAMTGLLSTADFVSGGSYVVVSNNRVARTLLSAITNDQKYEMQPNDPIPNTGMMRFAQDPKLQGYGQYPEGYPQFKNWGWEIIQQSGQGPRFGFKQE